jgi:hypothetical protein
MHAEHPLRSKLPDDSNAFERRTAMALRSFVLLFAAYVFFHKLFPFTSLDTRLADLTFGEFMMLILQVLSSTTAAGYFIFNTFRPPPLPRRVRAWCEFWSALAFGVISLIVGSVLIEVLARKGFELPAARWIARGILWVLL